MTNSDTLIPPLWTNPQNRVQVSPPVQVSTDRGVSTTSNIKTKGENFLDLWKTDKRFKVKSDPMVTRAKSFVRKHRSKDQPFAKRAVKKAITVLADSSRSPQKSTMIPQDKLSPTHNHNLVSSTGSITSNLNVTSQTQTSIKPKKHLISII